MPYKGTIQDSSGLILMRPVVFRGGSERLVSNPSDFPDAADAQMQVVRVEEPMGMIRTWVEACQTDIIHSQSMRPSLCRSVQFAILQFALALNTTRIHREYDGSLR